MPRIRVSLSVYNFLVASLLLALACVNFGCANSIPPQGGALDETPPQLDTAGSTPNFQTNFEKQEIVLAFDEWLELDDIATQVVVSPPVDNYDMRLKKKTVRFTFGEEEVLRPDVTYTINFGSSIQDLTEGNPVEDMRFVFSTGDVLDSLEVRGQIRDALTGLPTEEAMFLLYDNLSDTVVRTERPFYFAKTDTAGRFQIRNVKGGTFKGFALKDSRPNYQFDAGEAIGFPDTLIVLDGSSTPDLAIRMFQEVEFPNFVEEEQQGFGRVKLVFDGPADGIEVITPNGPPLIADAQQDSLVVWYTEETPGAWNLVYRYDTLMRDTIRINRQRGEAFLQNARLRQTPATENLEINPRRPFYLGFNHPLAVLEPNLMILSSDSTSTPGVPQVSIDSTNIRRLRVAHDWNFGHTYRLDLLPGALFDIFGIGNGDTIRVELTAQMPQDFGNINLSIAGLDSTQAYVLQIRDDNQVVIEERTFSDVAEYEEVYRLVPPGQYELRLVTDHNRNGQWDTGNYDLYQQPEPIFLRKLEPLRANWDVDAQVDFVEGAPPETG